MNIDQKTVYKVADLARIAIRENEIEVLTGELGKILTFMDKLNELDTTGVAPLVYMNDETNIWRDDQVKNELSTADALKNTAVPHAQFFLVPKVIDMAKEK